jgi:hypothetical protein
MERRVFGDGERAPGSASSLQQRPQTRSASGSTFMELAGLEPATSWVRSGRSPCARFVFRCPDDAHSHRSWLAHSDTWTALTGELTGELGQESLQIDFQGGLENRRNSSAAIKGAGAAQVEQAAKNATTPAPRARRELRGRQSLQLAPSLAQLTREWRPHWRAAFTSTSFPLQIGTLASSLRIRVRRFDSCRGHPACSCGIHGRSTCDGGCVGLRRGFGRPLKTAGARLSRDAHWRAPGAQKRRRNDCEARSRAPLLDRHAPWHADLVTACSTTEPRRPL